MMKRRVRCCYCGRLRTRRQLKPKSGDDGMSVMMSTSGKMCRDADSCEKECNKLQEESTKDLREAEERKNSCLSDGDREVIAAAPMTGKTALAGSYLERAVVYLRKIHELRPDIDVILTNGDLRVRTPSGNAPAMFTVLASSVEKKENDDGHPV